MPTKVLVTGTFDLFHSGHLYFLQKARSMGDYLIVCVDTDERVRSRKGENRPFCSLAERVQLLQELRCVNRVETFGSDDDLIHIIIEENPDVYVVGADYRHANIVGERYLRRIEFIERIADASTTKRVADIAARG